MELFIHESASEYIVCEMVAICLGGGGGGGGGGGTSYSAQ